ncbi:MAG: hypothetical protein M1838_004917 [Thelocarpon superellum]|nr:MAG: hypothetical protein M1838_004917 [Thelocarpon superellum]
MSTGDPINANPTILNPADLPTRRPRHSQHSDSSLGINDSIFASSKFSASQLSVFDPLIEPTVISRPAPGLGSSTASLSDPEAEDEEDDDSIVEPIDAQEIFDLISTISDPEHPLSLGSLAVVSLPDISVQHPSPTSSSPLSTVTVLITPTITHCSLATVIGLGVRVRLEQSLPPRFRVDVRIKEGTHSTAEQVTKQLNDKERVAAALENGTLMGVLNKMLETCQ